MWASSTCSYCTILVTLMYSWTFAMWLAGLDGNASPHASQSSKWSNIHNVSMCRAFHSLVLPGHFFLYMCAVTDKWSPQRLPLGGGNPYRYSNGMPILLHVALQAEIGYPGNNRPDNINRFTANRKQIALLYYVVRLPILPNVWPQHQLLMVTRNTSHPCLKTNTCFTWQSHRKVLSCFLDGHSHTIGFQIFPNSYI